MSFKRMKFMDSIDEAESMSKHAAIAVSLGREIRIFVNPTLPTSPDTSSSSNAEEPDDFYDITPEDYYNITSGKLGAQSPVFKTQKIRKAEEEAHRARLTKATVRVRFPDDYILEACFHPSEKIHSLYYLLNKVVARPDLPFYIYTTPPKERIEDMAMDFHMAKFVPGAIVYFCYEPRDGSNANAYPYLHDEIKSLYGSNLAGEQAEVVNPEVEEIEVEEIVKTTPSLPEPKPVATKSTKPKWFKL